MNGRHGLAREAAVLILLLPRRLGQSLVQSAALGSCSMAAPGGSGQGSGVQCSAHHLKVPAPEVQSFWSFIYYNLLFFFLLSPPPPFTPFC